MCSTCTPFRGITHQKYPGTPEAALIRISSPEFKAPWNTLFNNARVYTPDDQAIQTPNSDTPYSYLGNHEPDKKTFPEVSTFNFAYVGSRAMGNEAANFLLAGPKWKGETPLNLKDVIRSETDFVFVLYRTQFLDPDDIEDVKNVQAGY